MAKEINCRATEERLLKGCGKEFNWHREWKEKGKVVKRDFTAICNITDFVVRLCPKCQLKLDQHRETKKDVYEDVKKMIKNLENPYPSDIWEGKTKEGKIGQFGNKVWENCKEELNKKLGEEKQ